MRYVVVDLEWNPISRELLDVDEPCKNEIIQIGAVLLDDQYREVGQFVTLVKPELNTIIERKIEKLTGITTDDLTNAPIFQEAMHMFLQWCCSIPGEVQLMQWSRNDLEQILREADLKAYQPSDAEAVFLSDWYDFQNEYDERLFFDRCLSLKDAVFYAGLTFEGDAHDALWDARNTGNLVRALRDPSDRKSALNTVIDAMKPKKLGATLGDLFCFDQFTFAAE